MSFQDRVNRRRVARAQRVRRSVRGNAERPRICVTRSGKHLYAQVIDDEAGRTVCEASSVSLKMAYGGNVKSAKAVGEALGKRMVEMKIGKACFDRGGVRYHGRVKALCEAVRAAGVQV